MSNTERDISESVIDDLTQKILALAEGDVQNYELVYACHHASIKIGEMSCHWRQFTEESLQEAWFKESCEKGDVCTCQ